MELYGKFIPPSHPDTPFLSSLCPYPPFQEIPRSEKNFITYTRTGLQFLEQRRAEFELHGNVHVRLFEITAGYIFLALTQTPPFYLTSQSLLKFILGTVGCLC